MIGHRAYSDMIGHRAYSDMIGHRAYIGLGANLGNPVAQLEEALRRLEAIPGIRVELRSSFYRTQALDGHGHADPVQPAYVNAVAGLDTTLDPEALLQELLRVEAQGGRVRSVPNAARTIDLDLLLYDEIEWDSSRLCLPHPRMHLRRFVLEPLVEIAPGIRIGNHGPARELLAASLSQALERI
jgi:2-amino-4-hydroxy-6-hydroxymethyldihydropteridine diphosphokinase